MKIRFAGAAMALTALLHVPAVAQDAGMEVTATHVAGTVWMLEGQGGNIGVSSGPDGVLMADDQFARQASWIREALGELCGYDGGAAASPDVPVFLIDTHKHRVSRRTDDSRARESEERTGAERLAGDCATGDRTGGPSVTFDQGFSIQFNGEEVQVFHLPNGHADGDVIILFKGSNVVHMGDDFFAGRFPLVDIDNGGSVMGLAGELGRILGGLPDDVIIIPGHGRLSNVEDLRLHLRMLRETIGMVREKMGRGTSVEQIREEGVAEEWAEWDGGFVSTERWLGTVYRSLAAEAGRGDARQRWRGGAEHGHGHGGAS